jgi:DNA-binding LacI/PurR family transcriptional regulator
MTDDARTGRPPTMRDVAERAGVSRQLVSLVMRGAAGPSAASRAAIMRAADELDFRPNASARLLRQERTRMIGVLFEAHNPFEARFVERLLERAPELGFSVSLAPITPLRDTEAVVRQLMEFRVEALACFNPDPSSPALQHALGRLPVVWLGERPGDPRADAVHADDERGFDLVLDLLTTLGHAGATYVGGLGGRVGPDRVEAYRSAMRNAGLGAAIDEVPVGFSEEDGAAAARILLARPDLPTAVVCCSDQAAVGVRAVFAQDGIRVPEQVSVTGFDDSDVAAISYNDLTAVRQDIDLTVEATLDAIVRRLEHPEADPVEVATTATLTVRGSTARARAR